MPPEMPKYLGYLLILPRFAFIYNHSMHPPEKYTQFKFVL